MIERCAICGSNRLATEHAAEGLDVSVCPGCDHREARHTGPAVDIDYHAHTPQQARFLRSLETTRRRQARCILARVPREAAREAGWVDLGSGRGWFLDEARAAGIAPLAGFDTSDLARRWLREADVPAAVPRSDDPTWPDWSSLAFVPAVVTVLDVLEHFPREHAEIALRRLRAELPGLRCVVVKVPVSDGVLYRSARALKRIYAEPYRQLYQVGTAPPHHHYFSSRSLPLILEKAGFEVTDVWTDPDVDNLFHRIPSLAHLPGGGLAARVLRWCPADSAIAFARPHDVRKR